MSKTDPARAGDAEKPAVKTTKAAAKANVAALDALPKPTEASGLVVPPASPSPLLWVPRVLFFVPKVAFMVAVAPVRGGIYVTERYELVPRVGRVFFNDAKTFGIYPTAAIKSGFGFSLGGKMVHRDMFGAHESFSAAASYGGRFDQSYKVKLSTGDRLTEHAKLGLQLTYDRRPKERFFGIGNGELQAADSVGAPVDPTTDETAVKTRYREEAVDLELGLDIEFGAGVAVRASSTIERREFEESEELGADVQLTQIYDPASVPGYDQTLDSLYSELELRFDTRRPSNRYISASTPSEGWLLAGSVGFNIGLTDAIDPDINFDKARQRYRRYSLDLQRYFDLYDGTRSLGLRLLASQIDADIEQIPFIYLPQIGGDTLLRGYDADRFRDRGIMLGTLEYKWEVAPRYFSAFLFTDVGRPQDTVLDPEFTNLRVGFGGGLQFYSITSFIARAHLASSIDGGLFFNLDFSPVIDARIRK